MTRASSSVSPEQVTLTKMLLSLRLDRASDADAFLAGVARDEVSSFDHDGDHDLVHLRGAYQAPSPLDTDIWVASAVDGALEWDIRDGDWAIVALNADGSPGIDIGMTASAKIPFLTTIGVVFIVAGVIGISLGILLTYYGVRRVRQPRVTISAPGPVAA